MDLRKAIGLLGLDTVFDTSHLNERDVEKAFRKQALLHHPDKGGDASKFRLLHRAKDRLLEDITGRNANTSNINFIRENATNSRPLYKHRSCVRQLIVAQTVVVAATDDGLVVIDSNNVSRKVVSNRSFLCCCCDGHVLYAGSPDGRVHQMDVSTYDCSSWWQLPRCERIVAISAIRNYVALATAEGSIYVLDYYHDAPTIVWKSTLKRKSAKRNVSPETILLEEGSSPNSLNLWVGGGDNNNNNSSSSSSNDKITGRLFMWKFSTDFDFWERTEDLFQEYCADSDSDTDDSSSNSSSNDENDWDNDNDDPAIDVRVPEGPIFSLSKHKRTIAVASGQCIRIWDYNDEGNSPDDSGNNNNKRLVVEMKTIHTDTTLYALCLNERFLAAAGDSILVYRRYDDWTIADTLELPPAGGCHLATNCVMTLAWFHHDDDSLVSGGYDGVVTLWKAAANNTTLLD